MKFVVTAELEASAKSIYSTWLNSIGHSEMTGGTAVISSKIGENFTAWDGYISGRNILLEPYCRIVQSWRTTEFTSAEEDSVIELILSEEGHKTRLTLTHSKLPDHGEQYIQGWEDHYFQPMKQYFSIKRKK